MQLKIARTLWGIDGFDDPTRWDAIFAKIKAEGFDGIETSETKCWTHDLPRFRKLLKKHDLELIGHLKCRRRDPNPSLLSLL